MMAISQDMVDENIGCLGNKSNKYKCFHVEIHYRERKVPHTHEGKFIFVSGFAKGGQATVSRV